MKRLPFSEVRSEMAAQRIGVRQMARLTGCSPGYMSFIFNGKSNLTPHLAKKLEAVLSIEITDKPVTVDDLNSRLNAILDELLPHVAKVDIRQEKVVFSAGMSDDPNSMNNITATMHNCPKLAEQLHARMSAFVPEGQ